MNRPKIEVVEIALGTDVDINPSQLASETQKHIEQKLRLTAQEQEALKKVQEKREKIKKTKQNAIETCYELMLEYNKQSELMPIEKIKELLDTSNLSSFMLRLKNYIQKRENLWQIKKQTKNGKKYYSLIPS